MVEAVIVTIAMLVMRHDERAHAILPVAGLILHAEVDLVDPAVTVAVALGAQLPLSLAGRFHTARSIEQYVPWPWVGRERFCHRRRQVTIGPCCALKCETSEDLDIAQINRAALGSDVDKYVPLSRCGIHDPSAMQRRLIRRHEFEKMSRHAYQAPSQR